MWYTSPSKMITYSAIIHACNRMDIACDLHVCRKVVDMLQGRVSQSVLARHYLVPAKDLREKVLSSLDSLDRLLER